MCLAVYVGSAVELPERPWSLHPQEFNVEALVDRPGHDAVRRRLQAPFVYDVGAHTSCACGFVRPVDGHEVAAWERSMGGLRRWLTAAVEAGPVDLLICWEGDEGEKPRRRTIRADAIAEVDFGSAESRPLRLRAHR